MNYIHHINWFISKQNQWGNAPRLNFQGFFSFKPRTQPHFNCRMNIFLYISHRLLAEKRTFLCGINVCQSLSKLLVETTRFCGRSLFLSLFSLRENVSILVQLLNSPKTFWHEKQQWIWRICFNNSPGNSVRKWKLRAKESCQSPCARNLAVCLLHFLESNHVPKRGWLQYTAIWQPFHPLVVIFIATAFDTYWDLKLPLFREAAFRHYGRTSTDLSGWTTARGLVSECIFDIDTFTSCI